MYKLKAPCFYPVSESIFYFVCSLHFSKSDVTKGIGSAVRSLQESGMKNTYFQMAFKDLRIFIWLETLKSFCRSNFDWKFDRQNG